MSVLARFSTFHSKRSVNALVRDPQKYLESFSCSLLFFSAHVSVLKLKKFYKPFFKFHIVLFSLFKTVGHTALFCLKYLL